MVLLTSHWIRRHGRWRGGDAPCRKSSFGSAYAERQRMARVKSTRWRRNAAASRRSTRSVAKYWEGTARPGSRGKWARWKSRVVDFIVQRGVETTAEASLGPVAEATTRNKRSFAELGAPLAAKQHVWTVCKTYAAPGSLLMTEGVRESRGGQARTASGREGGGGGE